MAEETKKGLSTEELESQTGEPLPDREAMSVVWIEPTDPPLEGGEATKFPIGEGVNADEAAPTGANEPLGGGETL